MNKKFLVLSFSFAFLVLSFNFCHAASIVKDTQADFTTSGSSFESTSATIESGDIILELSGGETLWTTTGEIICDLSWAQGPPRIISDGNGGAVIAWYGGRGAGEDISAQRINSNGDVQWAANGVDISPNIHDQYSPELISNGSGGAIITWFDDRAVDNDTYAQKVNSSGTTLWTTDGVTVSAATGDEYEPKVASDGSDGAIIAWQDYRHTESAIYAQRVDGSGSAQWITNGVTICAENNDQEYHQLISDGSGGAIVTWHDYRDVATDIYAQLVDDSGTVQWITNGTTICAATGNQELPQLVSDGNGGAIITWEDPRGGNDDIYAQRIDSGGAVQWAPNGVAVCAAANDQINPQLISDEAGGAIITWRDRRNGTDYDIYAQRIDSDANPQWTPTGVSICAISGITQSAPQLASDGNGGAIIAWSDSRGLDNDIYAQRINSEGIVQWTTNGITVSAATNSQSDHEIVSDGSSGAIITWQDNRGASTDIYAQRINEVYFASGRYTSEKIENTDSLFAGWTTLGWAGSGSITAEVKTATSSSGLDSASWVPVSNAGNIPNRDDATYKWLQVKMDFTPSNLKLTTPQLNSFSMNYDTNTTPPSISNVQSDGVSVSSGDVINPSPTIEATITDTAPGVDPSSLVITIDGTDYSPDSFASGAMSYTVTTPLSSSSTHTISIRASDYANNTATWEATGLRILEGTQATNVINVPNPFNPNNESTDITYQLSQDSAVSINIYTMPRPELIRRIIIAPPAEGAHTGANSVPWDGRNQGGIIVPNGVYFYQVVTGNKVLGSGNIIVLK